MSIVVMMNIEGEARDGFSALGCTITSGYHSGCLFRRHLYYLPCDLYVFMAAAGRFCFFVLWSPL